MYGYVAHKLFISADIQPNQKKLPFEKIIQKDFLFNTKRKGFTLELYKLFTYLFYIMFV